MNFAKFVRAPFLQNTTVPLRLIIAVSIAVKGELANETVNYNTKTKAKLKRPEVQVIKKGSPRKKTGFTSTRLQIFFKIASCS